MFLAFVFAYEFHKAAETLKSYYFGSTENSWLKKLIILFYRYEAETHYRLSI